MKNKKKYRTFKETQVEYYNKHPNELKEYIAVALEEYEKDKDSKAFMSALSVAIKVKGGYVKLSRKTGLNRENLYRTLKENKDPRLSTVASVIGFLGYTLRIA